MSSISWVGNKVVDPGTPRLRSEVPTISEQQRTEPNIAAVAAIPVQRPADPDDTTPEMTQQGPPPSTEPGFIPYFLTTHIGRYVRAEFIIGTNQYVDKAGVISEVGINYFVLDDINLNTRVMCDLYSVKFVTLSPEVPG